MNWLNQTDILAFTADKNVNVVIPPAEGMISYYTDWLHEDPASGRNKWGHVPHEGVASRPGPGAGSVGSQRARRSVHGGHLRARSGDPGTGGVVPRGRVVQRVRADERPARSGVRALRRRSGRRQGRDEHVGPYDGPGWEAHDPYLNAEKLRGLSLYVSNGSGLPGPYENPALPRSPPQAPMLVEQIVWGGLIEAATNVCTHRLADRLRELQIPPATFRFRADGTHSWGYWQDELYASWPQLAAAMGSDR